MLIQSESAVIYKVQEVNREKLWNLDFLLHHDVLLPCNMASVTSKVSSLYNVPRLTTLIASLIVALASGTGYVSLSCIAFRYFGLTNCTGRFIQVRRGS